MTDLAHYTPPAVDSDPTDPTDPRWHGVIELSPSARDLATLAAARHLWRLRRGVEHGQPGPVVRLHGDLIAHRLAFHLQRSAAADRHLADKRQ